MIPTGELIYTNAYGGERHPLNFTSASLVKQSLPVGLDHCFIFDRPATGTGLAVSENAQLEWSSPATGIRMRVKTNQPAIQVYSCSMNDGSTVTTLGKADKFGCMAIEPQGW